MKRRGWEVFFVLSMFGLTLGCAAQKAQAPKAMFQPQTFEAGAYVPKVNDFVVIFDASTSMGDEYMGQPKLDLAKETVSRMNRTLPDLGYRGELRTFGQGDCLPGGTTSKIYGLTQYSESGLEGAIQKITCTGGNTPMESALAATAGDLKGVPGKIAAHGLLVLDDEDRGDLVERRDRAGQPAGGGGRSPEVGPGGEGVLLPGPGGGQPGGHELRGK